MGNQGNTSESAYRLYARPAPGGAGDTVEVLDDGGTPAETREAEAAETGRGSGEASRAADGAAGAANGMPPRRGLNPYMCAAWVLVGLMLAGGLLWFTGALPEPNYGSYSSVTGQAPASNVMATNLYSMGGFLLLFGLVSACTLLTVQAARYRR